MPWQNLVRFPALFEIVPEPAPNQNYEELLLLEESIAVPLLIRRSENQWSRRYRIARSLGILYLQRGKSAQTV